MKISNRLRVAIMKAVDEAAAEVVTVNAPACDDVPPEEWTSQQKAVVDQACEVAYRSKQKIQALLA